MELMPEIMIVGMAKPTAPLTTPANKVIPAAISNISIPISAIMPPLHIVKSDPTSLISHGQHKIEFVIFVQKLPHCRILVALHLQND